MPVFCLRHVSVMNLRFGEQAASLGMGGPETAEKQKIDKNIAEKYQQCFFSVFLMNNAHNYCNEMSFFVVNIINS